MNAPTEYSLLPIPAIPVRPVIRLADLVKQHPAEALLLSAGLGFAAVLLARALMPPPPPPRNRAAQTLEDILHRLKELAQPAYDRASSLAQDGAHAVDKGLHSLGDLHLDRKFDKVWRGFTGLFH